ncbi:MAG: Tab2/Atab2 family RNA-binding protein [Prochloraceae cyanobacterium]|nr:Tab2/Atab2 family RNA-binding protein [Prochloraceae cyanobacterium]
MTTIWELDFYSRPLLDENKKKLWEVLICESPTNIDRDPDSLFKYSQLCSNTTVNSIWLREAIEQAIAEAKVTPKKIRFFRRQMNNMIVKACEDAGIEANPSRRTYALNRWLAERMENVYPDRPEYDPKAVLSASIQYPPMNAIALPDAVKGDKGDKWAFVTLEAAAFQDMKEWEIGFGESFPLSMFDVNSETKIPGLIFFSPRSLPLAGWMSGLEMGFLQFEAGLRPKMRLETGVSDSWILANLTNPQTLAEAKGFEEAKKNAGGVHFLAVQSDPESESFAGFWLLLDRQFLPSA